MANENELQVIFGADGRPLERTLAELESDLKQFQAQLKNIGEAKGISDLNKQISITKASIEKIKNFNIGSDGLTRNVKQSSQAVFAFNQILRETPAFAFSVQTGILALSNNIPIFVDRIKDMQAAGVSGGNIFKDLAKSLVTFPSLITIGVSVLTLFADKLFGSAKGADEAANKVKELLDSLRSVSTVSGETSAGLQGEISLVTALAATIKDTNKSYDQRKNALDRLRSINKAHFGDLTLEASSLKTLTARVNEYTNALVAEAIVKAFTEDIGKANKALFDQNTVLDGLQTKMHQAQKTLDDFNADLNKRHEAGLGETTSDQIEQIKLMNAVKNTTAAFNAQRDVVEKVATNMAEMTGALENAVANQSKFKPLVEPTNPPTFVDDSMEKASDVLRRIVRKINEQWDEEGKKMADSFYTAWAREIADGQRKQEVIDAFNGTNDAIKKGIVGIAAAGAPTTFGDQNLSAIDQQSQLLAKFKELGANPPDFSWLTDISAQNMILVESLNQTYNRLATIGSVVNEFVAPALQNFFNDLISGSQSAVDAVISFFKNLVRQLAVTIATAAALAAIMSAFGLGGGAGFSGLFKKFLGFGGGGGSPFSGGAGPSGLALAGAATGSAGGMNELNFRLDGNDLVASINRTNQSNGRMGG